MLLGIDTRNVMRIEIQSDNIREGIFPSVLESSTPTPGSSSWKFSRTATVKYSCFMKEWHSPWSFLKSARDAPDPQWVFASLGISISAITLSFGVGGMWLWDAFHILNRDPSLFPVILNLLRNPRVNCCRCYSTQFGIRANLRRENKGFFLDSSVDLASWKVWIPIRSRG